MPKPASNVFIFKYTSLLVRLSSKYKTSPFNWSIVEPNSLSNNPLTVSKKPFLWYCTSIWHYVYILFLYISLYQHFETYVQDQEYIEGVLHILWCLGLSFVAIFRTHQLRRKNEMMYGFNQMIKFVTSSIEKDPKYANEYLKRWKIFDKVMGLTFPLMICGAACYGGIVLVYPYHHRYIYLYLLPSNIQLTWGIKFGFFICEFIYVLGAWASYVVENFICICFIDTLGTALNVLNKKKTEGTHSIQSMAKTYQQLHLLSILHTEGFSGPFGTAGQKFACTIVALGAISVGIRLASVINPIVTLCFYFASATMLGALGLQLPLSANIHERSTKFSFPNFTPEKCVKKRLESRKLISACKPFAIRIGDFYDIHLHIILTFLSIFIGSLINILIALSFYTFK